MTLKYKSLQISVGKEVRSSWIKEGKEDVEENCIKAEEAVEREMFQENVLQIEGFEGRRKKNAGSE